MNENEVSNNQEYVTNETVDNVSNEKPPKKVKKPLTKKKKTIIISVSSAVAAVLVICLTLLIVWVAPVEGKVTTEHWYSRMTYTPEYAVKTFHKDAGKDFKILCIADPQLADAVEPFGKGDPLEEITKLVEQEEVKPDLIIVMGDITWTAMTKLSVKKFVKHMDKIGIPWAPIMGNHEDEKEQGYFCSVDKNWVADQMMKSKTCLFRKGPNNIGGVGNYVINVEENGKIVETLVFMDSHAKRQYPEYQNGWYYDYIYDAQMLWYKWIIDGVTTQNGGIQPESMLYIHIPLPEYETAYYAYKDLEKQYNEATDPTVKAELKVKMDAMEYSGINKDGVWGSNTAGDNLIKGDDKEQVKKEQLENGVNSGFFDVLKDVGSTKYVFAGHDHQNNYSVLYDGIRLTYTAKTGYKCSYVEGQTGGTIVTIGAAKADGISRDVKIVNKFIKY